MDPDPNRPERIVEAWFAGDHANIGGGWATDRLSDITLDFLLRRVSSGYADSEEPAGREDEKSWGQSSPKRPDSPDRTLDHERGRPSRRS